MEKRKSRAPLEHRLKKRQRSLALFHKREMSQNRKLLAPTATDENLVRQAKFPKRNDFDSEVLIGAQLLFGGLRMVFRF